MKVVEYTCDRVAKELAAARIKKAFKKRNYRNLMKKVGRRMKRAIKLHYRAPAVKNNAVMLAIEDGHVDNDVASAIEDGYVINDVMLAIEGDDVNDNDDVTSTSTMVIEDGYE